MTKKNKPLKRKIHFSENEVWSYKISLFFTVIKDSLLNKYLVKTMFIAGYTDGNSWEKDTWKSGVEITPKQVKDYITKHLRKTK